MKVRNWQTFLAGAVVGAAAVRYLPAIARAARPLTRSLVAGAVDLSYRAKTAMAEAQEELGNMVAEAQYQHSQPEGSALPAAPVEPEPWPPPPLPPLPPLPPDETIP